MTMDHKNNDGQAENIAALILAAGLGSRMGNVPKCLIRLDEKPILLRQIDALRLAGITDLSVITGFYFDEIESVLAQEKLRIIRHTEPELGQQSSVRLGLEAIDASGQRDKHAKNVLITLGDLPLINQQDIHELMLAFKDRPVSTHIMYPVVGGQRGNPVMMTSQAIRDFLTSSADMTCRKYIDTHPSDVYRYATQNDHFVFDLDTRQDLAALAEQTGLSIAAYQ